jgi:enoyl-CoA hydratase/carnithine racemase
MGDFVRIEVDEGIGTIRWERPPLNALNRQLQDELREAAQEVTERREIAAVVLYGGEKVFAAGADIKEMKDLSYAEMLARVDRLQSAVTALAEIPKPVVAAITGYALGGGFEVALAADFRVCGSDAKVGQPEIQLGIIPGAGGTQRLARLIGPSRAKDVIFTGRFVEADEALRLGMVDEVVAPAEVYAAAKRRVRGYVGGPAVALRAAKTAIDVGLQLDLASGLRLESQVFASLFATEDRAIGMESFVENGPGKAAFVGR